MATACHHARAAATRLVAALLAAGAAGCGAGGPPAAEPPLVSGSWQLVSGATPDGELTAPAQHRITLVFEGGRVGGTAACNSYGGSVEVDGERLVLGDLSQTEMACDPPVMAAEAAYLAALRGVDSISGEGKSLVLAGAGVELRFEPLVPPPTAKLVDADWELDTLLEGDVASTPLDPPPTLRLGADGAITGSTGCRSFRGRYVVRGDEVIVTRLEVDDAATAGVCPHEVVEQERVVFDVLGDGFTAEVEDDRLTVTSSGAYGLVYRAP
jgi:heat shock protein HslJ